MLGIVCASVIFTMGMGAKPPSINIAAIKAEVEEELPKGAPVSDVVKFLEARNLPHTGLQSPEHAIYSVVQIRRSAEAGSAGARAELQFWFTPDGKFIHFFVREYDPSLN